MDYFVQYEMLQKMLKYIKNNLLFIHMSEQEFPL